MSYIADTTDFCDIYIKSSRINIFDSPTTLSFLSFVIKASAFRNIETASCMASNALRNLYFPLTIPAFSAISALISRDENTLQFI